MRDFSAYEDEMGRLAKFDDRDLERLLAGRGTGDEEDLLALASFVWWLRDAQGAPPASAIERRHLSAIIAESRLIADKGEPVVRPARKAREPASKAFGLPKRRRVPVLSALFTSLTAKIITTAVAASAAVGGLGVAGALPEPAQNVVHEILGAVGLEVPDGGEEGDELADAFDPAPLGDGPASEHADQTAKEVLAVVDGWLAGEYATGCEFGQAVAAAAGGQPDGECPDDPGAQGKAKGEEAAAAGKAKAEEASAAGKAKAEEAAAAGKAKGQEAAEAGKAKGAEASETGSGMAGDASGGAPGDSPAP